MTFDVEAFRAVYPQFAELSDDQIELVTGGVNDDYKPAGRF